MLINDREHGTIEWMKVKLTLVGNGSCFDNRQYEMEGHSQADHS